jgi:hydrogenase-4 component E
MTFDLHTITVCAGVVFLLALLLNLTRKNTTLIALYLAQSVVVAFAFAFLANSEGAAGLLYTALLTFAVKGVMAPIFLYRLVSRYSAHFSAAWYLSVPTTLVALAVITGFSYTLFPHLGQSEQAAIPLLFASIFSAFFLMVNRRGALSMVVGVLALENGIVLLATALGAAHTFALEFTVAFDIAVWVVIASVFLGMLHHEFGTPDTDTRLLRHLTEE